MSSQYFGFDDDETANISDIKKTLNAPRRVQVEKTSPDKLSISQIQALLCQDLTTIDSTLDSSSNETSIYEDEQDCTVISTLVEAVTQDEFYQDESTAVERPEKIPRKVLGDIENKTPKVSKTYKKPAQATTAKKTEKIIKPAKKRKTKKKNDENENYDKFAEQINKQFAQVESFKLVVE